MPADREYRDRIYATYVTAQPDAAVPQSLNDLAPRLPYLRKLIREHFPADRDASVLDLGCGHGALLHVARTMGYLKLRGVDASPAQVAAAERLGISGVTYGDAFATVSIEPDGSQDVIVSFDLIEHLDRDELFAFAREVRRALRPQGRWIIHTVNAESPLFGRIRYGDITHEMAFTRASITQMVDSSGFSRTECFEDRPVVHGPASAARAALWLCMRFVLRLWLLIETGTSEPDGIFSQNFLVVATK
jgi:SAM-dependent methyltransferase